MTTSPPVARRSRHAVASPHGERIDEYYWLRDDDPKAKRPEIIEYLDAENGYCDAMLAPLKPLQEALVAEMRGRIRFPGENKREASGGQPRKAEEGAVELQLDQIEANRVLRRRGSLCLT